MKRFLCSLIWAAGIGTALAGDDVPLDKPFSFHLDEPSLREGVPPMLKRPRVEPPPALTEIPRGEVPPLHSKPREFNGETYYFILL